MQSDYESDNGNVAIEGSCDVAQGLIRDNGPVNRGGKCAVSAAVTAYSVQLRTLIKFAH